MWTLRRTARPRPSQPTARLRLEALDLRLPPSSLFDPVADPLAPAPAADGGTPVQMADSGSAASSPSAAGADQPPADNPPANPPGGTDSPPQDEDTEYRASPIAVPADTRPKIINFKGVEVVGGLWRLTGDVVDAAPGGLTVSFGGGPVSINGKTATTDANGHFDLSVLVNRDGSDYGVASAQTTDRANLTSDPEYYFITPS